MTVTKYLQELQINRIGERTQKNHKVILSTAAQFKAPLEGWTRDDVNAYIIDLQTKMKPGSVETYKIVIRKYFRWLGKPEIVAHIKAKMPKSELTRDDILTPEEINMAIEATPSTLYQALIAFLFDSGGRVSEATGQRIKGKIVKDTGVRVRNIEETDKGMVVSMPTTKTSKGEIVYRRVLCVFSAQYIRNHIAYCGLKKDDLLFDRDESSILRMFDKIKKDAGITKRFRPHGLRHAQATDMVLRNYQESIIRKKMGWSADSAMIARYTHLVDDDVINATAEKNGGDIQRKPIVNLKQAESLSIADASMQLAKIHEDITLVDLENNEMRDALHNQELEIEELKKQMKAQQDAFEKTILELVKSGKA